MMFFSFLFDVLIHRSDHQIHPGFRNSGDRVTDSLTNEECRADSEVKKLSKNYMVSMFYRFSDRVVV